MTYALVRQKKIKYEKKKIRKRIFKIILKKT